MIREKEAVALLPFGKTAFRARVALGHFDRISLGGKLVFYDKAQVVTYVERVRRGEVKIDGE